MHNEQKAIFPDVDCPVRTGDDFINQLNLENHHDASPLLALHADLVSKFHLDDKHLVCLGVVKKVDSSVLGFSQAVIIKASFESSTQEFRKVGEHPGQRSSLIPSQASVSERPGPLKGGRIPKCFALHWPCGA